MLLEDGCGVTEEDLRGEHLKGVQLGSGILILAVSK